jgi:hypothetical protein
LTRRRSLAVVLDAVAAFSPALSVPTAVAAERNRRLGRRRAGGGGGKREGSRVLAWANDIIVSFLSQVFFTRGEERRVEQPTSLSSTCRSV